MEETNHPHLVFTCGREPAYPRNDLLLRASGTFARVQALTSAAGWLPARYAALTLKLLGWRLGGGAAHTDALLVGFYGHPLMLLARALAPRKPILFDAFVSTYDTLVADRGRLRDGTPAARLARWLDRAACAAADTVIVDTNAHGDYFHKMAGVPREKLRRLFVGCDEQFFTPRDIHPVPGRVLFYGSFMPLHGVDVIVRAAALLKRDRKVSFRIIGAGMQSAGVQALARELGADNIEFCPPVPLARLPDEIAAAEVCLGGHFGASEKAARVIAGKTFQCLSMGKAVIVGDNPANRELLTPDVDAYFCAMSDPAALAEAIQALLDEPGMCQRLGAAARQTILARASLPVLAAELHSIVDETLVRGSRPKTSA